MAGIYPQYPLCQVWEILLLERLKVLRTVSQYSVAGSEPNTVLVAKTDTLGWAQGCQRLVWFAKHERNST